MILNAMKITGQEQAADIFAKFVSDFLHLCHYVMADKFHFICSFNASLTGVSFQIAGTFSDRTWYLHKLQVRLPPTCQIYKAFTTGKTA